MLKLGFAAVAALIAVAPAAAVTVTYGAGSDYAGATVTETFDGITASDTVRSLIDTIGGVAFNYFFVNVGDYGYGNGSNYVGAYNNVGIASLGTFGLGFDASQTYFGLLITSSDASNAIDFYDGGNLVYSYTVGSAFTGTSFVNFAFGSQQFDVILFTAAAGTGFESDNHTVAAIPEPASWALMIAGFGLVGVVARRRQRTVAA